MDRATSPNPTRECALERAVDDALAGRARGLGAWLLGTTALPVAAAGRGGAPAEYAARVLRALDTEPVYRPELTRHVPASGGVIVAANHPYGSLDGLALLVVLSRIRTDVKVLANRWLASVPELAPVLIPVDVLGTGAARARRNAGALRRALRWVAGGGALLVFPAGEVASLRLPHGVVADPPWPRSIARFLRLANVPVVPAFVAGANGALFHAAGLVHPRLRTALLARELVARRGTSVRIEAGAPIDAALLARLDDGGTADHVRLRIAAMAARGTAAAAPAAPAATVAEAGSPGAIVAELDALGPAARVAGHGELEVWRAPGARIPATLREIARLRELTFRAVGEGTGRALDLDAYDARYEHVFLWHAARREIAGAYRVARIDRERARGGTAALYTSTLFALPPPFFACLGPALELGRSFIRIEYQRSFAALLLLWRGIASIPAEEPRYATLIGPASLSAAYTPESRALIVEVLRMRHAHPLLSRLARGRHPVPATPRLLRYELRRCLDLESLDRLVRGIEPDGKGVPVLLQQYLRLGARVAGFNVDATFAGATDVLVVADLRRTERTLLARYMGDDGLERFEACHARGTRAAGSALAPGGAAR